MQRFAGLLLVAGALACGGGPPPTPPPPETELVRARELVRRGNFPDALPIFQRVSFELSPAQPEYAEVRYWIGECYYQVGDYAQAAAEFRRAADGSPESEWAPQSLLRAGDANLKQWRRPELDPSFGEAALAIYQELAGRYPSTDAAGRAVLHVRKLQAQFAEKLYKTGQFYLKRRAYDSAILYFKEVIANYPESPRAQDALLRLVDAYRRIGYHDERLETCEHLRRFYPKAQGLEERCPASATTP